MLSSIGSWRRNDVLAAAGSAELCRMTVRPEGVRLENHVERQQAIGNQQPDEQTLLPGGKPFLPASERCPFAECPGHKEGTPTPVIAALSEPPQAFRLAFARRSPNVRAARPDSIASIIQSRGHRSPMAKAKKSARKPAKKPASKAAPKAAARPVKGVLTKSALIQHVNRHRNLTSNRRPPLTTPE